MKSFLRTILRTVPVPLWSVAIRHYVLRKLKHPVILVFNAGKVGSTTVCHTIRQAGLSRLVYHVHYLTPSAVADMDLRYIESGFGQVRANLYELITGTFDHRTASSFLSRRDWKKDACIITIVRDPIERAISFVFQNPRLNAPELLGDDGELNSQAVLNYLQEDMEAEAMFISDWFESEFEPAVGTPISAVEFDQKLGYGMLETEGLRIVAVSLALMGEALPNVLSNLYQNEVCLQIEKRNVRSESRFAGAYGEARNQVALDEVVLRRIYETGFAKQFFSLDERNKAIAHWSRHDI